MIEFITQHPGWTLVYILVIGGIIESIVLGLKKDN